MTREKFYEIFGKPCNCKYDEKNKIIEVVKIKTIFNRMLNMYRNLNEDYKIQCGCLWSKANTKDFDEIKNVKFEEILEKSNISKYLYKMGYKVQFEISFIQKIVNNDIHSWNVYAIFKCDIEALRCYWGNKYKQKVFIFTNDGVFEIKHDPKILKDETNPYGYIGVNVEQDAIVIS